MSNEFKGTFTNLEAFLKAVDPVSGETHGKRFLDRNASLHTVLQAFERVKDDAQPSESKIDPDLAEWFRKNLCRDHGRISVSVKRVIS